MKISVVIPCRNEAPYIEECIEAIYDAYLPDEASVSVFVVDGMSTDGTIEKIQNLKKSFPTLEIIENSKMLTPYAFNLGIYASACDYVQIIGARHIISKNYISSCLQKLQKDPSVWCVGGKIDNVYINQTGRIISKAMGTSLGMGIGNFRTLNESGYTDTVTSPMYPYWVFEKIGFFDEELIRNQDDDFNYRVTNAGGKIFFDADISLKYYVRGNYKNLWKQFSQYGYWKVYVNQKHQAVTTARQLVPPAFVIYLFMVLLSWTLGNGVGLFFSIPLISYIGLVLYISNKITNEDNEVPFLSIAKTFPILHISYGLGYLKGIVHFVFLRRRPSESNKQMSR